MSRVISNISDQVFNSTERTFSPADQTVFGDRNELQRSATNDVFLISDGIPVSHVALRTSQPITADSIPDHDDWLIDDFAAKPIAITYCLNSAELTEQFISCDPYVLRSYSSIHFRSAVGCPYSETIA